MLNKITDEKNKEFKHQLWRMESSSGNQNWNFAKAMVEVFKSIWDGLNIINENTVATQELLSTPFTPRFRKLVRKNFGKRPQAAIRFIGTHITGRF